MTRPNARTWTLVGLGLGLGGCAFGVGDLASVPDAPTYTRDIAPILADHCLLCHSAPASRGAPDYFRLDTYADTDSQEGARTMKDAMVDQVDQQKRMPPAAEWGDGLPPKAKATLLKWVANGAPE